MVYAEPPSRHDGGEGKVEESVEEGRVKEDPVQHEVGEQRGAAGETSDGEGVDVLPRATHNPDKSLAQ
eukprot:8498490-Pyramimonas_sp.AAC.1